MLLPGSLPAYLVLLLLGVAQAGFSAEQTIGSASAIAPAEQTNNQQPDNAGYASDKGRFTAPATHDAKRYNEESGRYQQPDSKQPDGFNPRDPARGYQPPEGVRSKPFP